MEMERTAILVDLGTDMPPEFAKTEQHNRVVIGVAHGSAEARRVMEDLKRRMPDCEFFVITDVSSVLSGHTGPGLIGIAVQALPG